MTRRKHFGDLYGNYVEVGISRRNVVKELLRSFEEPQAEWLQLFDDLAEGKPHLTVKWTALHRVWLMKTAPSFFAWLLREGFLPDVALRNTNLSWLELPRAQFHGAMLSRARFHGSVLRFGCFRGADLTAAQFQGADLTFGDLCGADAGGADFSLSNLRDADFVGADLRGVLFEEADLTRVEFTGALRDEGDAAVPGWALVDGRLLREAMVVPVDSAA